MAHKSAELIASIKAYKEEAKFLIKGEFHPNIEFLLQITISL